MPQHHLLHLFEQRPVPVPAIMDELVTCAERQDPVDFDAVRTLARKSGLFDETVAQPALASLVAWESRGIDALREIAAGEFFSADAQRILVALASDIDVATVLPSTVDTTWFERLPRKPQAGVAQAALSAVRELILRSSTDERVLRKVVTNLFMNLNLGTSSSRTANVMLALLLESRLQINRALLDEYRELLDSSPTKEEELHRYLFDHPVLLDPLALEIRSKHALGDDLVTDFVIRRFDGTYVLVEVEKSTERLFTATGRVHSDLTDALSQVRDFQAWIHDNISYAQSRLPGVRRPAGLVVIGRSSSLAEKDRGRLEEENFARSGYARVVTYDDLLDQATTIYENLISQPLRYAGKQRL